MKTGKLKVLVMGVAAAISTQLAVAQTASSQTPSQPKMQTPHSAAASIATEANTQSQHDILLSQLHKATVKSDTGQDLGKLEEILVDPQTGQIGFAVLGRGGFLGFGETLVPVPWQSVVSASANELTLNVNAQKLQSAPKLEKNYSNLNSPEFMAKVDQFYGVTPTAAGAAGETPGGVQTGTQQQQPKSKTE